MIFKDVNCGFYTTPHSDLYAWSYEEVLANQENNGIRERVIYNLSTGTGTIRQINETTLRLCAGGGASRPLLHLMPPAYQQESYTKAELQALIDAGALFRACPDTDASPLLDWMYGWTLQYLEESGTPLLVSLQDAQLRDLAQTMACHPRLKLILTNTTQWLNRQYLMFLKSFPSVMMETSNIIEYYGIENIVGILGAERILFGTFMPDKEPYDKIFQVLYCELAEEQKQLIAYGNYDRVIGGAVR